MLIKYFNLFFGKSLTIVKNTLLALALLSTISLTSQSLDDHILKAIDSLSSPYNHTPGMALLIARDGNTLFKDSYGYANYELSVPSDTRYSYAIGSLSKQFTAVAILKLEENGQLKLKDDIRKFLPWIDSSNQIITIESLLTHTSGIKDFLYKEDLMEYFVKSLEKREMIEYIMKTPLIFNPGTRHEYSNSNYIILSLIIEEASGLKFEDYLMSELFSPIGLKATFVGTPTKLPHGTVTGYRTTDEGDFIRETYLHFALNWVPGAGNIYASVEDMLQWHKELFSFKIISEQSLTRAINPYILPNGENTKYGYGFRISNEEKYLEISHGGAINGFQANMVYIPEGQIYLVAMSNRVDKPPSFIHDLGKMIFNGIDVKN